MRLWCRFAVSTNPRYYDREPVAPYGLIPGVGLTSVGEGVSGTTPTAMLLAVLRALFGGSSGEPGVIGNWTFYTPWQRRFRELRTGSSREDAVSRLGKPQREEPTLRLPQAAWYASQYDRVKGSGAVSFLYWRTGIDGVAVLGLDASGRVVFKFIAGK